MGAIGVRKGASLRGGKGGSSKWGGLSSKSGGSSSKKGGSSSKKGGSSSKVGGSSSKVGGSSSKMGGLKKTSKNPMENKKKKKIISERRPVKKALMAKEKRKQLHDERANRRKLRQSFKKEAEKRGLSTEQQEEEFSSKGLPAAVEPRTIENTRPEDETIVELDDPEVKLDDQTDEFSSYFRGETTPKIMLTTGRRPSAKTHRFISELLLIIPNIFYYKRRTFRIKAIIKYATKYNFTDIIVLNEKMRLPHSLYISHLPGGPTSCYRLTNLKMAQDMKGGGYSSDHKPEIVLNHFDTRLGHRIGRQLAALFPQQPEFTGRRVITFHNQRDFIFFRHHRYVFEEEGKRCRLKEIGPRFTLKLRWLQHGTFDTTGGQFEFVWKPDMQVDRRAMFM